jgi:2-dehydro-3-deoxyphosphogluconate aldolase/(4S)-4-hydroxy-2-oxoglutarate aldolase
MKDATYISEKIAQTGVLPVINVPEASLAVPLAKALIDGGMTALEITLRSDCSLEAIKSIKATYPDFLVGAATVLTPSDADAAISAGADFIVSPGLDPELVAYCQSRGVLIVPGCVTPTEIQFAAVKCGLTTLKFFPAELSGGVAAIKLLSGPFPKVKFVPTGGITFDNLGAYLATGKVLACGGSFMASADQVKNARFDEITLACKKAIEISNGAKK